MKVGMSYGLERMEYKIRVKLFEGVNVYLNPK